MHENSILENHIPQPYSKPLMPLSELMLALTAALDMTEGQPPEHCIRCCWIGMHIGQAIGLDETQRHDLFYLITQRCGL